jgi:hypothetical protein
VFISSATRNDAARSEPLTRHFWDPITAWTVGQKNDLDARENHSVVFSPRMYALGTKQTSNGHSAVAASGTKEEGQQEVPGHQRMGIRRV